MATLNVAVEVVDCGSVVEPRLINFIVVLIIIIIIII
jgi:hypothetical protein